MSIISYSDESCRQKDHSQVGDLLHLVSNECENRKNSSYHELEDDIQLQEKLS